MIRIIYNLAGYINIGLCYLFSIVLLIRRIGYIKKVDVLVIMPEGGFGHTITGPDVTRRLFKDQKCVFVALSEFNRHNWKVAEIWPDIELIFLPLNLGVKIFGHIITMPCLSWYKENASKFVLRVIKMISTPAIIFNDVFSLYKSIPMKEKLQPSNGLKHFKAESHLWPENCLKLPKIHWI